LTQLALCLISLAFTGAASAQAWPAAKPIRIVIAFGPGSASDIFARMIGEPLQKALGQVVLVEAKPGAGGVIAADFVAKSSADGYTLFLTTNTTHSANPYLFKKLSYDPVKDFTPVARIGYFPFVLLVNAKLPINSVKDLIAYAKATPGSISYAYTSSAGQVAAAALSNMTNMGAVGVAYKAAPQALTDVAGGQEAFTVIDFATSQPFVKSGRLRGRGGPPAGPHAARSGAADTAGGGGPDGFRRGGVARRVRAGQRALGHRRSAERGDPEDPGAQGNAGPAVLDGRGGGGRGPQGARRFREEPARRLGAADQDRGHEARVM
jgi:hypothetical protein